MRSNMGLSKLDLNPAEDSDIDLGTVAGAQKQHGIGIN